MVFQQNLSLVLTPSWGDPSDGYDDEFLALRGELLDLQPIFFGYPELRH
jgi:hypothetical protein